MIVSINPPTSSSGEQDSNKGWRFPQLNYTQILLFLVVQFGAIVWWAQGEHSARLELQRRFEQYVTDNNARFTGHLAEFVQKNKEQDAALTRLDETGSRNLSRKVDLLEDRQSISARAIAELQTTMREHANEQAKTATAAALAQATVQRLDERFDRIVQALDATYALINDHIRLDHASSKTGPTPRLRFEPGGENRGKP